jgi:ketosteroid isomerase-like protein
MSQKNVEVVRRFVVLELEEALTYADTHIVWNPVEEPAREGHDAVRENLARWEGGWEEYEATPEEFLERGDRVLVTVRIRGRGKGSGIEIDARFYELYTLRNGKIMRMDEYTERAEALEAVGLSE